MLYKSTSSQQGKNIWNQGVSVVIGVRGKDRIKSLLLVLDSFRKNPYQEKFEIIVVEADKKPQVYEQLVESLDVSSREIVKYVWVYSGGFYNRGWVFNVGVKCARFGTLILHDSDLLVPEDFIQKQAMFLSNKEHRAFNTWGCIQYLNSKFSQRLIQGGITLSKLGKQDILGRFSSQSIHGGSVCVRRNFFLEIKGCPEEFEGWGCEDDAFRLKASSFTEWSNNSIVVLNHLYHNRSGIDKIKAKKANPNYEYNCGVLSKMETWSKKKWIDYISELDYWGNFFKYAN